MPAHMPGFFTWGVLKLAVPLTMGAPARLWALSGFTRVPDNLLRVQFGGLYRGKAYYGDVLDRALAYSLF